jgi:hypothetical protein
LKTNNIRKFSLSFLQDSLSWSRQPETGRLSQPPVTISLAGIRWPCSLLDSSHYVASTYSCKKRPFSPPPHPPPVPTPSQSVLIASCTGIAPRFCNQRTCDQRQLPIHMSSMDFSDALYVALHPIAPPSFLSFINQSMTNRIELCSRLVNLGVGALMVVGGIWHIFPEHYLYIPPLSHSLRSPLTGTIAQTSSLASTLRFSVSVSTYPPRLLG